MSGRVNSGHPAVMRLALLLCAIFILSGSGCGSGKEVPKEADATGTLMFEDGFESIAVGDYPDKNGWQNLFSRKTAIVSNDRAHSGSKSLRLESRANRSRTDYVPLPEIPDRLTYEASVYADPIPGRSAFIGFVESFGNMGPVYLNFSVWSGDGSVGKVLFHRIPNQPYMELTKFQVGTWVTVRADLDFASHKANLWVHGELIARNVAIAPKEFDDPSYGHVVLGKFGVTETNWAGGGTGMIYVDDVRISSGKTIDIEMSTASSANKSEAKIAAGSTIER